MKLCLGSIQSPWIRMAIHHWGGIEGVRSAGPVRKRDHRRTFTFAPGRRPGTCLAAASGCSGSHRMHLALDSGGLVRRR